MTKNRIEMHEDEAGRKWWVCPDCDQCVPGDERACARCGFDQDEPAEDPEDVPDEEQMEQILADLLADWGNSEGMRVRSGTFQEEGIATRDRGLVVRIDAAEYQITIVRR